MSLTQDEQRTLASECDLEFKGWDELAAYTSAVEAKERERIALFVAEKGDYSTGHKLSSEIRSLK